ncbi:hypothetical protein [Sphingomonas jeddahensis]|nr:hypothetical protein [Sphingomonas jeddahensis]
MNAPVLADARALPRFCDCTPTAIEGALAQVIAEQEEVVTHLTTAAPTDFASAWLPLERADTAIDALWSTVSHLHGVADNPELRAAHAAGQALIVENSIKTRQNHAL